MSFDRDTPTIYTYQHATSDANLIIGDRTKDSKHYRHFQFGVESNYAIDETNWEVLNDRICYYDSGSGSWKYEQGKSCQGSKAWITWKGTTSYGVGGATYTGVNKEYSNNAQVNWKYTGSTLGVDVTLWTESGTVSDVVSKPYS